ncbi:OsmC family protein [Williamsia sp. CHRR-6]|uniref:OsmC family protein n=1 Tax=Williamsia sp. CHRR-6 TaxID=2835871 RepID=UPI001BDB5D33|nr:OsmC family protein [Williamsia sp. CHRR-6]MBT0568352.1 OsmC family protein [Williamsia sp. CHRR-6]
MNPAPDATTPDPTGPASAGSAAAGSDPTGSGTDLWVERTGTRRYTGRSSRGAEVLIGSQDCPGVFTPGELMKIALGACTGMSSDVPLARRLGEDYPATIRVSGAADRDNEVYPALHEVLELDLSALDEATATRLLTVVERAVDAACTVGRTLKAGTAVTLDITGTREV